MERPSGHGQGDANDGVSGSRQQHAEANDGAARDLRVKAAGAWVVEGAESQG
jgi:hypothetical protein